MKKKTVITITIVLWLIILIPLGFLGYIQYQIYSLTNDVEEYLLKTYDIEDTENIDTTITLSSFRFSSFVTFKDEPEHQYEYIRDNGDIIQYTPYPSDEEKHLYKHLDKNKVQ
ncbi:DUF3139 domain-containing protein [Cytobacillus purgationiresistens]|uniref:DUF3139 domain-containing protein n=1 Tax=Cytobacillus purgationiresistens TaxID=863449 RepID=A0ABU0ASV5_9BACI|nr:DUF3139 domain-containing protein [Cytobacillus purgationiresistens]MDQ0273949.1 hypothetical protein [Cytobacillus purgationiresistens]